MTLFELLMLILGILGGLWVTFRMRSIDPWARLLGAIVGAAVIAIAFYQGLHGQSAFSAANSVVRVPRSEVPSSTASILPHAIQLFIIVVVSMAVLAIFYAAYFLLKERHRGVLRTRMPTTLRNILLVSVYMFAAILPMSLEKHHVLHLTNPTIHGIMVAYVSLIAALILVAMSLAFDKELRRHKVAVVAFFCGLVIAAGSSPFIGTLLANDIPALQPIGVLFVFALGAPGPAYFVLRYQLGWL